MNIYQNTTMLREHVYFTLVEFCTKLRIDLEFYLLSFRALFGNEKQLF